MPGMFVLNEKKNAIPNRCIKHVCTAQCSLLTSARPRSVGHIFTYNDMRMIAALQWMNVQIVDTATLASTKLWGINLQNSNATFMSEKEEEEKWNKK